MQNPPKLFAKAPQIRLLYAFLLMGFTAVVAQVILVRELFVVFAGNELSIGILFGNWLLLEALGSWSAGLPETLVRRRRPANFACRSDPMSAVTTVSVDVWSPTRWPRPPMPVGAALRRHTGLTPGSYKL